MSKELSEETKYEFNVYARQLSKDLSNLMDCLRKQDEDNKAILYVGRHIKKKIILPYEEYQKMCQRLEAIDNSSPSEALECLEEIGKTLMFTDYETLESKTLSEVMPNYYRKCKQALLKYQEQEKVLEIIKEKKVNVQLFIVRNYKDYADYITREPQYISEVPLTQEDFELLKRYF